jgi:hypothetical protein
VLNKFVWLMFFLILCWIWKCVCWLFALHYTVENWFVWRLWCSEMWHCVVWYTDTFRSYLLPTSWEQKRRQKVSSKRWYIFTEVQGFTSPPAIISECTVVRLFKSHNLYGYYCERPVFRIIMIYGLLTKSRNFLIKGPIAHEETH